MMLDIYSGIKSTLASMAKKHCPFCAATVVGNGLLNAGLWVMCQPFTAKICTKNGDNSTEAMREQQDALFEEAKAAAARPLNEFFRQVSEIANGESDHA
jgi:hypothetical protein